MTDRLDRVLARSYRDFTPTRPDRPPWLPQDVSVTYDLAYTGVVAVVPLKVADRVALHGLDRPSWDEDGVEPGDWTRAGWTPA